MTRIRNFAAAVALAGAALGAAAVVTPAEAQLESADCADVSGSLCGSVTRSFCFNLVIFTTCTSSTEHYYEDTEKEKDKTVT